MASIEQFELALRFLKECGFRIRGEVSREFIDSRSMPYDYQEIETAVVLSIGFRLRVPAGDRKGKEFIKNAADRIYLLNEQINRDLCLNDTKF